MPKQEWIITIDSFGGFAPAWFENPYPTYGNKNQAADMMNIDIMDPNVLTQGPGLEDLLNENQEGVVSLMRGILRTPVSEGISYGIGKKYLYQITPITITNSAIFPHVIDKADIISEDGEDIIYYKSKLYYFYNHSGNAGDIGQYDLNTTFDDDWGSTVPVNAETIQYAPHQAINGGDDVIYFTNGRYIGTISIPDAGITLDTEGLDFWENSVTVSLTWNNNRVIAAVNRPDISGAINQSAIYTWNGVSSSWEGDPIEVNGRIGALYTKNGVTFVWWQDATDENGFMFGYISGLQLMPIKRFKGSLPLWYQVGEYKGFVCWVSEGLIYLWGAKDPGIAVTFSQYCEGKYSTVGGIATPFGKLLIASKS